MDYYDLLGVKRSASADELKTAYKKQAMKNHPDKGGDPEKFKQINEAYQALSDPQQKQMYDQFGTTDPQQARMNQGGFHFTSNSADINLDDIFASFGFGTNFGQGFRQNQRRQKNKDIRIIHNINFEDLFTGRTDTLSYKLVNGQTEILDVRIPPGVKDGDAVKFKGYGDNSIAGFPRGDLILTIRVKMNPLYRREGNNLYFKQDINILDLITGTTITIATPDKKSINLTIPPKTAPKTIFSISNAGIPDNRNLHRGTLFVEFNCVMPDMNESELKLLNQIKKSYNTRKA